MTIASVRILRLATGTVTCLLVSQIFAWPMSFIAPIFTMTLLALPMPALALSAGVKLFVVFLAAAWGSLLLLPFLTLYPAAGLLLVSLALYRCFYFSARGGSAILGMLISLGITLVAAIGSVSIDAIFSVLGGLTAGIMAGIVFVWLGHALMPDSLAGPAVAPAAPNRPDLGQRDLREARYSAGRSLLIVMPVLIYVLFSPDSAGYVAVMIKVTSMGQQASLDHTRTAAKSLLLSTVLGGVAAILIWQVLGIHASLTLYVLLVALGILVFGPRIFSGPALAAGGPTWSYGLTTMLIVLGPAVLDLQSGSGANAVFYSRLFLLLCASLYGITAVFVFDLLFESRRRRTVAIAS